MTKNLGVQLPKSEWSEESSKCFTFTKEVGDLLGNVKERFLSKHKWYSDDFNFRDCLGIYTCQIEQTYRSIEILLHHGHTGDCFTLLRKLYEALITLGYLCTDRKRLSKQCIEYQIIFSLRLLQYWSALNGSDNGELDTELDSLLNRYTSQIVRFMKPNQVIPKCGRELLDLKFYDSWTTMNLATIASKADMKLAYQTTIRFCTGYVHPGASLQNEFIRRDNEGAPVAFDPNPNPSHKEIQHITSDMTWAIFRLMELIYPILGVETPTDHKSLDQKWVSLYSKRN